MVIPTQIDIETLPDHDPERFKNFYEIEIDGQPAFQLQDGTTFLLDFNNGWVDEKNCYYNSLAEPLGWFVKFSDGQTFFYNFDGFFVPYKRDPSKLPKHKQKVSLTQLDKDYNFLDQDGCYYDKSGEPLGWKLQCEDGELYFFDLNGDYIHIDDQVNDLNDLNDLIQFDLGDFKYDFKQNVQYIKESQKPYPKEEPKQINKTQPQILQQKQIPKQQQKPKLPQKPQINQQNQQAQINQKAQMNQKAQINQKAIYHYELPDATEETKKLFLNLIKSKLENPEFTKNECLYTVKAEQGNKQLEQDLQLENGKCVKFKK
ncbi:unnamed protein product [Paramecium octaurelia]|uniref:Uncharacterized protein n=1 Tax=Paramecium octaurelia TaxID=43137 RepID=A0A8S1WBJ0_PAROT|nr:unnamed protein product [Paramecium octaurelia]